MTFEEYCLQYDITLNPQQREAVLQKDGQTLLLAVPGSGKTTVVIARTGYLIHCCGVKPKNLLTITYSKAAAIEMEERFKRKFGASSETPKFSTIHSLCVSVLSYARRAFGITVPKLEPDNNRIIRAVLYENTKIWPQDNLVKELALLLATVKNRMYTESEINTIRCRELSSKYEKMRFAQFYQLYEGYKKNHGLMDFDDQLVLAYDTLLDQCEVLHHFQSTYPYIGVDEAQDTSLLQFEIIRLLANGGKGLFVVGDDDQSIYSFRGADPSNILQFSSSYPEAKILYMETNYRNASEIVDAANRFISTNHTRFQKTAVSASTTPVKNALSVSQKETERGVYNSVIRKIATAVQEDKTLAVIARNNFALLPIVTELDTKGITVRRRDNFESFFNHPTISSIISIITLAVEPWNIEAFRRSRSAMKLYITNQYMEQIEEVVKESSLPETSLDIISIAEGACSSEAHILTALDKAKTILSIIAHSAPESAIEFVKKRFAQNIDSEYCEYTENISTWTLYYGTLLYFSERYKTIPDFLAAVKQYSEGRTDSRNTKSNVTLTTIHSAKGLEFDDVIILDAIDGILPQTNSSSNEDETDPEEEARLFYVAVTRAKSSVTFEIPKTLYGTNVSQSKFIPILIPPPPPLTKPDIEKVIGPLTWKGLKTTSPVPKETAAPIPPPSKTKEISIGCKVTHSTFGVGTVIEKQTDAIGDVLIVNFETVGKKRLLASFCTPI